MDWEAILKAWGLPALVGALTGIATLLLNRKLPFQQKLNEAQLRELQVGFQGVLVSSRAFVNQLHDVIFAYAVTKEKFPAKEDREAARQMIFQSFLVPEYLAPVQEMMFSIVTPRVIVKAVADYQVAMAALPVAAMNLVESIGPDAAWQAIMNEANKPLDRLCNMIRDTLGIDDLTSLNRYHAESPATRFKKKTRRLRDLVLRQEPASPYESLLFSTQMTKFRAAVEADLGSGEEQPTVEDLVSPSTFGTNQSSLQESMERLSKSNFSSQSPGAVPKTEEEVKPDENRDVTS